MKFIKTLALTLFSIYLLTSPFSQGAFALAQTPEYIRIGPYYGQDAGAGSSAGAGNSAPGFSVFCEGGISAGRINGAGGYEHLCDFQSSPGSPKQEFSRWIFSKSYAAVTGRDAASQHEVAGRVEALRRSGYEPQFAYFNGWVLIAGLYDTAEEARKAIETTMSPSFPEYGFTSEALSGRYIKVSAGGVTQFIYDAGYGNLQVWPYKTYTAAGGAAGGGSAEGQALLNVNGAAFRGAIEFIWDASGKMAAVNHIRLEEYLYGVVPAEIQASSHMEALKAQAAAARTFAVNMRGRHASAGYDLCNTTHCQVYGGHAAENARTSQAVDDTGGQIVTYNGAPAEVYYFSSSGGHTANVKDVWGGNNDYPYLLGVADKYESGDSYRYTWETAYTANELKAWLFENDVNIGDVTGVAITGTADDGRVTELTITGTRGVKSYTNSACRTFINGLHSQLYTVFAGNSAGGANTSGGAYAAVGRDGAALITAGNRDTVGAGGVAKLKGDGGAVVSGGGVRSLPARGTVFYFTGRGWGHGVGMSQEGAKGMAQAGFSYKEILAHYFPGCVIG